MYRARHERHRRPRIALRAVLILLLLLVIALPLAEPYMLEVTATTLTRTSLPSGVGQLRIVYVTDIHESSWPFFTHSRVIDLVRTINSYNADLVLLGGDYATDSESAIAFFEHLPAIHATYGVYGVLGNHDRTLPENNLPRLRAAMFAAGVTPLVNEVSSVRIGASDIFIAGIDDASNGWPSIPTVSSSVKQDDYVIFLSHSPAVIPSALNALGGDNRHNWFDLGLFGHTHGGQIPLLGDLLGTNNIEARYRQGWITENRISMLISRGVGTSVLPLRLFCRPQLHVITIKSGS